MCHCCQPCFPLCTLSSYIIELSSLNKLQIIKNEMLQRYVRCKIKRKNIITRVDRKRFWPSTIHFSEILLVRQCWNYAAVWQNAGAVLCYVNFTRVTCSYWSTYAFLWVSSWGRASTMWFLSVVLKVTEVYDNMKRCLKTSHV